MRNQDGGKFFFTEQIFPEMIQSFLLNCNINIITMTPSVALSKVFPPSFTLESTYLDLILNNVVPFINL